jgi:hypothetical protein
MFFETAADAAERPAGADAGEEGAYVVAGLLEISSGWPPRGRALR